MSMLLFAASTSAAALTQGMARPFMAPARPAVHALKMQETEVAADLMPPVEAESVVDLTNEAPPEQERFKVRTSTHSANNQLRSVDSQGRRHA